MMTHVGKYPGGVCGAGSPAAPAAARRARTRSRSLMAMNDDWRLRIDLHDGGFAHRLRDMLSAEELEHDLESSFHDRVVVSVDGPEVFCYAGTRSQAEAAEQVVRKLAADHGWALDIELAHWHPTAEEWQDPDAPLPGEDAAGTVERAERIADQRAESEEQGYPDYEVRVQCASRGDAGALSDRLEQEGLPNVHRWSYVLIGATDEDAANQLAERIRGEVPAGTPVTVETNQRAIYDHLPRSPFTILGGLGG